MKLLHSDEWRWMLKCHAERSRSIGVSRRRGLKQPLTPLSAYRGLSPQGDNLYLALKNVKTCPSWLASNAIALFLAQLIPIENETTFHPNGSAYLCGLQN